jgi:TDG/mug DNA glycosylase family protein
MPSKRLGDIVAKDLRILLVAINPPPASVALGHHFATPRNPFWDLMHASGLTPSRFQPSEARALLSLGIGLTSLVGRATRQAAELEREELRAGAKALGLRVERLRPHVVAVLGLTLFPFVCPGAREPGPGLKTASLGRSAVFVLPNPSGRNRAYPGFAAKLRWYRELAQAFPADR